MIITQEMIDDARDKVEGEVAYLSEDQRWKLLEEQVRRDEEAQVAQAVAMLRLDALRAVLCPLLPKKLWKKALRSEVPLEKRIHELRLAAALQPQGIGKAVAMWEDPMTDLHNMARAMEELGLSVTVDAASGGGRLVCNRCEAEWPSVNPGGGRASWKCPNGCNA